MGQQQSGGFSKRGFGGSGYDPYGLTPQERDWLRRQYMQRLGTGLLANGPSMSGVAPALAEAGAYRQEAERGLYDLRRQREQDEWNREYRESLIEENRAQTERYSTEAELKRQQQELALKDREALLRELGALAPDEVALFSDSQASADEIRRRILELRKPKEVKPRPSRSRTVGDQEVFEEFDPETGKWQRVSEAPRWKPGEAGAGEERTKPLTTQQMEDMISNVIRRGDATDRHGALEYLRLSLPDGAIPPGYQPSVGVDFPLPPRGATAAPAPAATPARQVRGIGADASTVDIGGQKIPLAEVINSIRDEPSASVALEKLVSLGVAPEVAKYIVRMAFS